VLFAAELIRFEDMVPLAVFVTFAALAWWALDKVASGRTRAVERLDELRNPRGRRGAGDGLPAKKADKMAKVLEKATPALAKPLGPKNEIELSKLRAKMAHAGFRSEAAGSIYMGLKFIGLLGGLFFGGTAVFATIGFTQRGTFIACGAAAFGLYLPSVVLWFLTKKRKEAIFHGLPDALDLLVVCVEAGLGLDQAMRKVAEEMKKSFPVIAEEFGLANFQLQMGRPRGEVLHELGARTGVADVRSLAAVIIQADKFGSSIATALRVQSDSMRVRRRQLAEEKAAKTAVKLIFPLVMFIFPGIFVILVGPAAVTMMRDMFPMMDAGK
jgi:tight adherence protein C